MFVPMSGTGTLNDASPLASVVTSAGEIPAPFALIGTRARGAPVSWSRAQARSSLVESFVTMTASTTAKANCDRIWPDVRTK